MAEPRNTLGETAAALLDMMSRPHVVNGNVRSSALRALASRYMAEVSFIAAEGGHPPLPSDIADRLVRDTEPVEVPGSSASAEQLAAEFTRACADVVSSATEAFSWWPSGVADATLVSAYLNVLRSRRSPGEPSTDISQQEAVEATIRSLVGRLTPYVADGHGAPEGLVEETAAIVTAIERGSAAYAGRSRSRLQ